MGVRVPPRARRAQARSRLRPSGSGPSRSRSRASRASCPPCRASGRPVVARAPGAPPRALPVRRALPSVCAPVRVLAPPRVGGRGGARRQRRSCTTPHLVPPRVGGGGAGDDPAATVESRAFACRGADGGAKRPDGAITARLRVSGGGGGGRRAGCVVFHRSRAQGRSRRAGTSTHRRDRRRAGASGPAGGGRAGGSKRWSARIFHPPRRTPLVPKCCNDAIPRTGRSRHAPESHAPSTFFTLPTPPGRKGEDTASPGPSPGVDAPGHDSGGRCRRPGCRRGSRHLGPRGRGRRPGARGNRRRAKGLTRGSVVGRAAA